MSPHPYQPPTRHPALPLTVPPPSALRLRVCGLILATSGLLSLGVALATEQVGRAFQALLISGHPEVFLRWSPPPLLALGWALVGLGLLRGSALARRAAVALPAATAMSLAVVVLFCNHRGWPIARMVEYTLFYSVPALLLPLQVAWDGMRIPEEAELPSLRAGWTWSWLHLIPALATSLSMVFWGMYASP